MLCYKYTEINIERLDYKYFTIIEKLKIFL